MNLTIYVLGFIVPVTFIFKSWFKSTQPILEYAREKYKNKYGELPRYVTTLPGFNPTFRRGPLRNWKTLLKEHPEDEKIHNIHKLSIKYGFIAFGFYIIYTILFFLVGIITFSNR